MKRLAIKDGWSTFILISLVVLSATWSIEYADWADGLGMLTTIALLGLAAGLGVSLARRIPALLAHLLALALGAVVVLFEMTNFLSDAIGGREAKLHFIWHRWAAWYALVSHGQRAEDLYLFVLLMGALTWILAYTSVWLVFRSRSIWLALLFSGIVVFTNLGYSLKVPTTLLILYLFASILLLMRFSLAEREDRWRRGGVPYPNTLSWRGLWVASYLSMAVLLFGWVFPVTTESQQIATAWQRIDGPWVQFRDTLNGYFASLRGPDAGSGPGGFAAFSDQFQIGGALRLSTTPVVVVKGGSAPYLIAHTYSTFTGTGWQSDDAAFSDPLLNLDAGQKYPLPTTSSQNRSGVSFDVNVLQPRGTVVYTADELNSLTVPSQIQVSWYYYQDQPLDVANATEDTTPPLLWPLVQLLKSADFSPPFRQGPLPNPPGLQIPLEGTPSATPSGSPTPNAAATPGGNNRTPFSIDLPNVTPAPGRTRMAPPENWADIQQAMTDLVTQHRVQTQIVLGSDYHVQTLRFTGRLPVYADLQAVFAQNGVRSGDTYTVSALDSQATVDQLRQATTQYPPEIASRYLQLPTTVSARVSQLAHAIGDPQKDPYDKASAIETFLRTNYKYNENVNAPPRGTDIVDYFLFQSKQGYCTYYSTAMVEMLRILGIPAREVVGFYPASFDQSAGGYVYRDLNSHAWVEAYFPGYGWISFEPTAARAEIARYVPPAPANSSGSTAGSSQLPPDADGRLEDLNQFDPGGGTGGVVLQHRTSPVAWVLRALGVAALIFLALVAYLWLRGLRGLSPATQLFTKLQRGASWGGIPPDPSLTPFEYAGKVSQRVPGTRPHASLLAEIYVRERYGSYAAGSDDLSRARHAWLRLRAMLLRHLLVNQWRPSVRARALDSERE